MHNKKVENILLATVSDQNVEKAEEYVKELEDVRDL